MFIIKMGRGGGSVNRSGARLIVSVRIKGLICASYVRIKPLCLMWPSGCGWCKSLCPGSYLAGHGITVDNWCDVVWSGVLF